MKQFRRPTSIDISSPEGLAKARVKFWPGGAPLAFNQHIVRLIEAVAEARGWDIDSTEVKYGGHRYRGNPPKKLEN